MKTKSTIKLFATAILATATINAVNVATHPSDIFASEVTQIPNKYNVGTRTTFETDPVFKSFEDGEKYLDNYVKPTIENSRYGYYTASVVPDGLGGNYLVSGFIDSHSEDEEVIKGNKETAQKIVDNAGKDLSKVKPETPAKPVEKVKPVNPAKPAEEVKPETPAKPAEEGNPVTPTKPAEEGKPVTPAKPVEEVKPVTPTKPTEEGKPVTPAKPVEDVKPVTPAKPAEEVKPETPAKPAEKGKPETPAKPVEEGKPVTPTKPAEKGKPVTPAKPVEEGKPVTPTKPVEDNKPETPAKPAEEGKTSNDIKEIKGKFTEIKTTSTGLTFKAILPEAAPHDGPVLPNIQATLTDKETGKEVAKTGVVLEGLSEEFKKADALLYANLLEGIIFEPSLTPGNYVLTVEGTAGATYGQNTDKRKRHFVFSTEVTLTGEGNATITTQPEKPKDSTTEPKSDQTTNNVNNTQHPSNDKNKQITNNNTGKQDKNELSTNKTSDTKTDKQNSDNTLSQEKQQTTSTSTTKQEDNKNNDKKTLPINIYSWLYRYYPFNHWTRIYRKT